MAVHTITDARFRARAFPIAPIERSIRRLTLLDRIDRLWAASILFFNGWIFALPIADVVPMWFTPIQVVHGVFLHEALLLAYVAFMFVARLGSVPRVPRRAWLFALLIAGFGGLALVSAFVNVRPLVEFFGATRYLLLAAYFFLAVSWTKRHGRMFVLRFLLLGIVSAGVINLLYTFRFQTSVLGGFPLLLGEQGPGGYLGMGIVLSAWLMFERERKTDTVIAVTSAAIGLFAVSISYSKLAMLMAAAGAGSWVFVLWRDLHVRGRRKWYVVILLGLAVVIWMNQEFAKRYVAGAARFVEIKFKYVDQDSVAARSQYFLIVAEIVAKHPVFGVSYGGFYEAAMATEASKDSRAAQESAEAGARGESNPHSSFLYYASANGIPGILWTVIVLGFGLITLARPMLARGIPGLAVWGSFVFAYLVFGLTLPTLFNSPVLYLPVAVGTCMRGQMRHRGR
jgi:hypothetical protein